MHYNIVLRGIGPSFQSLVHPPAGLQGKVKVSLSSFFGGRANAEAGNELGGAKDYALEVRLSWGASPWSFDSGSPLGMPATTLQLIPSINRHHAGPDTVFDIPQGPSYVTVSVFNLFTNAPEAAITSMVLQLTISTC